MRALPIRLRVAAAFAAAMAIVLAATGGFLYVRVGTHLAQALDRELRVRADDLGALVRDGGSLGAGGRLIEPGEAYAQLLDRRGRVLDATPALRRTPLLTAHELGRAARTPLFAGRNAVPGLDEPSRLLAVPVGQRVLVVGATRQDGAETLASLRDLLLLAGPIALLLATAAGYLLAGLSLRSVEAMRRRAAGITAGRPGERLPTPRTGDELERLAQTLNAMLARLEDALERERGLVADAGHELRTPLALLQTELELALRHAGDADELREAIRGASAETQRLAQLAEALLLLARSDSGSLPVRRDRLHASDLLCTVATRFEWRAAEARRPLQLEACESTALDGDRLRLEQALANLVDNALRHGAGTVTLAALRRDGTVELHVRDEGPGVAPELVPRAFERFTRADVARAGPGSGLGLAIVRAIAEAHGGDVGVEGADLWLSVPVAPSERTVHRQLDRADARPGSGAGTRLGDGRPTRSAGG